MRTTGILLILAALVVGIGGVAAGISAFTSLEVQAVDGTAVIDAESGAQLSVYVSPQGASGSCSAEGPDGATLSSTPPFGTEEITVNGRSYRVVQILTAQASGPQAVTCSSAGFSVGPRVNIFRLVGLILGGVFGGLLLGVTGLVLLIIGVRRGRRPAGPPGPGQWPSDASPGGWPQPPPTDSWGQPPTDGGWPQAPPGAPPR